MIKETRHPVVLLNKGQKIFGVIHRPLISTPYPAVLICHGLGGQKTGKYRLYVLLAEQLAAAGIASLRIDFRGSGDSEGHFSDMTLEEEVLDALTALEFLQNDPQIDASRVGIFGRSLGGTVAILSAIQCASAAQTEKENIKSLAIWASVFSGEQWRPLWQLAQSQGLSENKSHPLMRINGQIPGFSFFKELFELQLENHIHTIDKIPLLVIHGEKDEIVHIAHAENYARVRKKASESTHFIRLPQSDHDFSHSDEQKLALERTKSWFYNTL